MPKKESTTAPLRILIVEDRAADAELMAAELRRARFDPSWKRVETEAEYLTELQNSPDVILADNTLPQFSASRALKLLKESNLDIPLIVVTGSITEEIAVERIKQGAADYIVKDRMTRLASAVERALKEKQLRAEKRTSDASLRASEARKGAIMDSALDCIITMDDEGKIIEFNPAAERTFAYARAEVIGKEMANLIIPPSLRDKHRHGLAHYLTTGEGPALGKRLEITAMRADASEFPVELSIVRIPDSEPPQFTGFIRDITERKRREEEIHRNLERIRALHEIDVAITSSLDLGSRLNILLEKIELFVPIAAATTVRLLNQETGGIESVACRGISDEEEWRARAPTTLSGRTQMVVKSMEVVTVRNIHTDLTAGNLDLFQARGLVSYLGVPLLAQGEVLGVLGLYTKREHEFDKEEIDFLVTLAGQAAIAINNAQLYAEVKKRELRLDESRRNLEALYTITAAASQSLELDSVLKQVILKISDIFGFDTTMIYLYDKQRTELRLRASTESETGRRMGLLSFPRGKGNVGRVAETGEALVFEDIKTDPVYQRTSDSKQAAAHAFSFFAALPIKGAMKNLGTLLCIGNRPRKLAANQFQLLTSMADQIAIAVRNNELYEEVKSRAQELQQKASELETANRTKDEFLSVMSHELRTPLSVVMGYAGMIKEKMLGDINPQQEAALQKMLSRANDQLNLINTIMQTTQLEAKAVSANYEFFDLRDLLDQLKSDYQVHTDKKKVSLIWHYPTAAVPIKSDNSKLKQILQNLINNALKFTDRGSVTVSVRVTLTPNFRFVEFNVADTGIGISAQQLSLIFGKFHQVDSSETRLYGGVGLGLYIVQNFIDLLGGKIEVESEVGKGSTFTVKIPYAT
jgi:PAS domain S-box-containing protein